MPKLTTKIEGKGNGIKTVIVNMSDVSKALVRDPALPTKYFGVVLGAQVQVDDKTDRYIVNGSHPCEKLQDILDGFIKTYVLCPSCANPETTFQVNLKLKNVSARCKACGHQYRLKPDRITQYIMKNPPKKESTKLQAQGNDDGDDREEENNDAEGAISSVFTTVDESKKNSHDEVVWRVDASEEAAAKRAMDLSSAARNMTLNANIESLGMHERASIMLAFLHANVSREQEVEEVSVDQAIAVKRESDRLELGYRTVGLCVDVLLNKPDQLLEDVKRARHVFLRFTRSGVSTDQPEKAQSYLLDCIFLLVEQNPTLLNVVMKFTEQLYDMDIVEEDTICEWYEASLRKKLKRKPLRAQVLEQVKPLVEWLQNAEEESGDENESDGDDDENSKDSVRDASKTVKVDPVGKPAVNGVSGDTKAVNSDSVNNHVAEDKSEASRLLEMDDDEDIDLDDI